MKIARQQGVLTISDESATRWGVGLGVPIVSGAFVGLLASSWSPTSRLCLGVAFFAAQALALAVLRAPRTAEFDFERRELRLSIGSFPILRRLQTIPFGKIREAKVWRSLPGNSNVGYFRPMLTLSSGKRIFLSTFFRSRRECQEIIETVQSALLEAGKDLAE
jgi:hypothetical protein